MEIILPNGPRLLALVWQNHVNNAKVRNVPLLQTMSLWRMAKASATASTPLLGKEFEVGP
jgi:hypothetical protein